MDEFFLDDADYRKLDSEWKESYKKLKGAPSELPKRLDFLKNSVLLYCNVADDQRSASHRNEVLKRGMMEAEKCVDDSKECLKMWVVMAKYFKEQPVFNDGVSDAFHKLKARTGSLVAQYPDDDAVLELAGKVIMESRVPFWKRLCISLPTPPDASEAVPYFARALEMKPSLRRTLYLADALSEAGRGLEAREMFAKCAAMQHHKDSVLDATAHNECNVRQHTG